MSNTAISYIRIIDKLADEQVVIAVDTANADTAETLIKAVNLSQRLELSCDTLEEFIEVILESVPHEVISFTEIVVQ